MNNLHKYECSIRLVEYGKNEYEYEGHIKLLPNIVGSGKTFKEVLDNLYSNLDTYIAYCNKNSINYPKPNEQ